MSVNENLLPPDLLWKHHVIFLLIAYKINSSSSSSSCARAHFHFVLSLGAVIAIFSGVIFNGEKIVGSKNLLPSSSSRNSLFHLVSTFIGILITFSPMHFLGFNVMPRRIPDFPDSFHSWNFLSSIGSGITLLSFGLLFFGLLFLTLKGNIWWNIWWNPDPTLRTCDRKELDGCFSLHIPVLF